MLGDTDMTDSHGALANEPCIVCFSDGADVPEGEGCFSRLSVDLARMYGVDAFYEGLHVCKRHSQRPAVEYKRNIVVTVTSEPSDPASVSASASALEKPKVTDVAPAFPRRQLDFGSPKQPDSAANAHANSRSQRPRKEAHSGAVQTIASKISELDSALENGDISERECLRMKKELLLPHMTYEWAQKVAQLDASLALGQLQFRAYAVAAQEVFTSAVGAIVCSTETTQHNAQSADAATNERKRPSEVLRTNAAVEAEESDVPKKRSRSESVAHSSEGVAKYRASDDVDMVESSADGDGCVDMAESAPNAVGDDDDKQDVKIVEDFVVGGRALRGNRPRMADVVGKRDGRSTRAAANNAVAKVPRVPKKCAECKQLLADGSIRLFPGMGQDALRDEEIALTDPRLQFDGACNGEDITEKPVLRLAEYAIFDSKGHLVPIDKGLIESGVRLYVSGYIKFPTDDTPGPAHGVPIDAMGPLTEWYILGFDGGANAILGISTPCAEYLLINPHASYAPVIDQLRDKMYLSKIVIEFAENNPEAAFEDLIGKVQTSAAPNCPVFTDDALVKHAQFVVDRVVSYDECCDADGIQLVTTPCIRRLIEFGNVTLGIRRQWLRGGDRGLRRERATKKKIDTMATTTPLVRRVFDAFFHAQIDGKDAMGRARKNRCGVCEVCQSPDCGECDNCSDMPKFGGTGIKKQACKRRKCPNMAIREAEDDERAEDGEEDEHPADADDATDGHRATAHRTELKSSKLSWVGLPLEKDGGKTYYSAATIDNMAVEIGSFVSLLPSDPTKPLWIGQVVSLFQSESGDSKFHCRWLRRGCDTVLGETAHENELFLEDACDENPLDAIMGVVSVQFVLPGAAWAQEGGTEAAALVREQEGADGRDGKMFYCHKMYDPRSGRFVDIAPEALVPCDRTTGVPINSASCWACSMRCRRVGFESRVLIDAFDADGKPTYGFRYRGVEYRAGDFAYVAVDAVKGYADRYERARAAKADARTGGVADNRHRDEDVYPELYRKRSQAIKGSNERAPQPYIIGRIQKVSGGARKGDEPHVTLQRMFRSDETPFEAMSGFGVRELYWGDEVIVVPLSSVGTKCAVGHVDDVPGTLEQFLGEDHRFVFRHAYTEGAKLPTSPPQSSRDGSGLRCMYENGGAVGAGGKGKGAPGKGKASESSGLASAAAPIRPLRTLDIFAGCGGLSEGLHQSGACASDWAIEFEDVAAQAYRLNNPDTTVFSDDCNLLLRLIMDGQRMDPKGQRLPEKGDVECLVGGPPCQGYSGMNRFNHGDYSKFKNSLVVTYLSYLDFYRPKFFLLENVRNFVSFKNSVVVKLVLRSLLDMDYQCGFGVLQAGEYGVAQTRRRAFIWAAAPGEALPNYPDATHAFPSTGSSNTVVINNERYYFRRAVPLGAPMPPVTVKDALSDLPPIENGAAVDEISYVSEPQSDFQRRVRSARGGQTVLYDHICKAMGAIAHARICHIPIAPGSDWRDLPNKELVLSDGTVAPKLVYTHNDKRQGKTSKGGLRGVCICAETGKCDSDDRWKQVNTLIPWCLPHTGSRHNEWSGLYGRLEWDGHFSTTVTNPEPMGKQGRVLHPEQNRVVSVRECARSQGFPDHFRFYGSVVEKHRQVGNAVPPPLARALGVELKKAMLSRRTNSGASVDLRR